jgi:hypothetical protein
VELPRESEGDASVRGRAAVTRVAVTLVFGSASARTVSVRSAAEIPVEVFLWSHLRAQSDREVSLRGG